MPHNNKFEFFSLNMPAADQLLSHFSCVRPCATLWTVAHQAPLSIGFPRQEYWSGLPCPPPGDRPDPEIESRSSALQADSLPLSHQGNPNMSDIVLYYL